VPVNPAKGVMSAIKFLADVNWNEIVNLGGRP